MRIAVLTGGGDAPGLNAVIRAIVKKGIKDGHEILGIMRGWKGLLDGDIKNIKMIDVSGIIARGGTILKTSRTNPLKHENGIEKIKKNIEKYSIDAIIAIGGDDTLTIAKNLYEEGINIVGIPKTIDNDLSSTDYTVGFWTAVNIAMDAIDRLHSTAESHDRVIVVEIMGRDAGWVALYSGIAGGADFIALPEFEVQIDDIVNVIKERKKRGRNFSIIVVAEGAMKDFVKKLEKEREKDEFGHVRLGGIAYMLAQELKKRIDAEIRVVVLGHIQRGGSPVAYDRFMGTVLGLEALKLVEKKEFGKVPVMDGIKVRIVHLKDVVGIKKMVYSKLYEMAKVFFG